MTRPVDARTDQFVEEYAALDPIAATFAGIPGHEGELPDMSPDGYSAGEELHRRALADVSALSATDEREQVAQDAFRERIGLAVARVDAGIERSELSVISSAAHAMPPSAISVSVRRGYSTMEWSRKPAIRTRATRAMIRSAGSAGSG